jgi:hypothetical protein
VSKQCYLYIIAPTDAERPIKIGIASDPEGRRRQLQTGNPVELRVVKKFWALTREQAAYWEELAHQLFQKHRTIGEWFDVDASAVVEKVGVWKADREPQSAPQIRVAKSLPRTDEYHEPNHPYIPPHLRSRSTAEMSDGERLEFWGCFGLSRPPEGFDDWYIVGSEANGVLGAFPVVGFMHGVGEE